jgi:hypothetical protein
MKYLIIPGLILLAFTELKAQSDFRSGYIINLNGDTIYGLIDYKGNKANAKKCIFKEDINSEIQTFTPNEIIGYRFSDSKNYVSKFLNEGNANESFFLEYLIKGIVDIYYYRDVYGEHYLVDNGDGNLHKLKNEEKTVLLNNTRYIKESREYVGLLKAVFKDSPSVAKEVEHIKLNHESLITVAHDYHNEVCFDKECIIYEKKLPKIINNFGLIIGLNGLTISETGEFQYLLWYLKDGEFGYEIFPSAGLYASINMPYLNERLYFQYEGTYSHVKLTSTITKEITERTGHFREITLTNNNFNNLFFIKYEFPRGKIRPTFQFGGFFRYSFVTGFETKFMSRDIPLNYQVKNNPFRNIEQGINCGVGLKNIFLYDKEIFIDMRYQRGFGILKNLNTNTFSVNLGLQLW